jgi:hypothetical protein
MPRNGAGTFGVINPIIVGALRSSSAVNANFTDMGDEITNSLPTNGEAAMLGAFKAFDGTVFAPGIAFDADTNTGFRRSNTDEMKWVAGGVDRATMDANGKLTLSGPLSVAGDLTKTGGVWNPQTLAGTGAARLTMRITENDTDEREVAGYQSGSGTGAKASLRMVGGGANDVAAMRFYVNDVLTFQWTGDLFTHEVDTLFGASGIRGDIDGFLDFTEVSAPSAPGSGVARIYAKDSSGTTKLYVKDAAGLEIPLQREVNRQVFTSSSTWTKPTTGQTMALVEAWGGGGGGARDPDGAGGGGGGAYIRKIIALASVSASVSVSVGSGGSGFTGESPGGNGGNSSFGSYLTAYGGGGGGRDSTSSGGDGGSGGGLTGAGVNGGNSADSPPEGGEPLGLFSAGGKFGDLNWGDSQEPNAFGGAGAGGSGIDGQLALFGGGSGGHSGTSNFGDGGDSVFGGAGGGGSGPTSGGSSIFGGDGGGVNASGSAPGGAGGGAGTGTSGSGARGEVRITCW